MKQFLTITTLALCACHVQAQQGQTAAPTQRHIVGVAVGGGTGYDVELTDEDYYEGYYPTFGSTRYKNAQRWVDDTYHPVSLDVNYHYLLDGHWALGLALGFQSQSQQQLNVLTNKRSDFWRETNLSLIGSVRHYWCCKPHVVRTYFEAGLGIDHRWLKDYGCSDFEHNTNLTGQLTLMGLEVNCGRFVAFGEVGWGALGCLRGGVGYKF